MKPPVRVDYTPYFTGRLKRLSKFYRDIRHDLDPLIRHLEAGETPGDQVPGIRYTVYKVRLSNSNAAKGKRGGYRVLYYVRTADRIILLDMYAKTQQVDISAEEIRRLIEFLE